MPGIEDAPREVARNVGQANTGSSVIRTHPMVIVAAVAVTLFCGVGIAVMTGVIPSAQSGSAPSAGISAPPTPMVAGAAQAMAGNASEEALPQAPATPPVTSSATKAAPKHRDIETKPVAMSQGASRDTKPAWTTTPTPTPSYTQTSAQANTAPAAVLPAPVCRSCGVVESVALVKQEGSGSGAGAVLGGVVGGLLGHQVGSGRGKDVATVAGAVGGAVLGNQLEKTRNATQQADIRVRLEDGTTQTIRSGSDLGLRAGDKVRVENGKVSRA